MRGRLLMALGDMYGPILKQNQKMMDDNKDHIVNMLDFAIKELVEIAVENEIALIDDSCECLTYEQVFNCLKHWSEKRISKAK